MKLDDKRSPWTRGTKYCISLLCILFIFPVVLFSINGCGKGDETKAHEVVLYCSVDQNIAEPIIAVFEKETGVKVLARYDTEASKTVGLVQKIRAEAARPVADVFWSSEIFYTIQLADEGLLASYKSDTTEKWPAVFKDAQQQWFGLALRGRVIGYHTERVSDEEAPKSLEDLLDPKWKDRIVIANPDRGTTGGDVASWFVEYGPEKATTLLKNLASNGIRVVEGNSTAVRMVANGQADLCLTDTDDVYAIQRNGGKVALMPLDRNSKGTLAIPNTCAVLKGAPHPATASMLVEFLLVGSAERMLLESDSHNWPVGFEPGSEYSKYAIPDPIEVDYSKVAEMMPLAKQAAREILR
ncbi:MAG: extracellular solute-binding protein [Sedimentisphaerales bacterium]|nr:extracellular solute-binding protein [Sedimentisphaerales bacterium]